MLNFADFITALREEVGARFPLGQVPGPQPARAGTEEANSVGSETITPEKTWKQSNQ